jgi:cystathionine beta-lyase
LLPKTKLLLFCQPQNPTGRVFQRDDLHRLAELVEDSELVIVSDEIHSDLCLGDQQHLPVASAHPNLAARTVTLNAASKAFNIAGLRCAVAHFGSEDLQQRFNTLSPHLRAGPSFPGLVATTAAWNEGDAWLQELGTYLCGNRDYLVDWCHRAWPGATMVAPEATYLAWIDCRGLGLEDPYFLSHAKVALGRGSDFGQGGDGFVRVNFATSRAVLSEILERMTNAWPNPKTRRA